MPLYEFACERCGARDEVFKQRMNSDIEPPPCPDPPEDGECRMTRVMSGFAHHLSFATKVAEAEATYGAEVDAAMGPEPDIGKFARQYDEAAKDLPPSEG
ncbi:MAG: hypothetical protein F4Y97_03870 [Dehalococcoidia bacterium]|nr:hypothetical protein [Dehalococcoidia bacterium]